MYGTSAGLSGWIDYFQFTRATCFFVSKDQICPPSSCSFTIKRTFSFQVLFVLQLFEKRVKNDAAFPTEPLRWRLGAVTKTQEAAVVIIWRSREDGGFPTEI